MLSSTVFLVDQDLISSMIVKSKLVENPFLDVNTFRNGQECLVNSHLNPQIIILDYATKGVFGNDGSSTLKELRRSCPNTSIIVLTKNSNHDLVMPLLTESQMYQVSKGPTFSSKVLHLIEDIRAGLGKNVA